MATVRIGTRIRKKFFPQRSMTSVRLLLLPIAPDEIALSSSLPLLVGPTSDTLASHSIRSQSQLRNPLAATLAMPTPPPAHPTPTSDALPMLSISPRFCLSPSLASFVLIALPAEYTKVQGDASHHGYDSNRLCAVAQPGCIRWTAFAPRSSALSGYYLVNRRPVFHLKEGSCQASRVGSPS